MVVPNVCRSELTRPPAWRAARRVNAVLWLLLWLSLTPLVVGCGGCVSDDGLTEEEREAKREELRNKEKPKKDFEFIAFSTQPGTLENEDRREVHMKPGHWTSAVLETRANNFDFRGELASEVYDKQQQPVDLDQMPFRLSTTRPAILPKGQRRFLEFSLFAPAEGAAGGATRLLNGAGGRMLVGESHAILPMPAHQYYFVVLALNPDSYRFLQRVDSVTAPHSLLADLSKSWHYRIVAPRISKSVAPLPSSAHQLDQRRLRVVGRPLPENALAGPAASPGRLAALGRATDRQRSRFAGNAEGQLFGALSARRRRRYVGARHGRARRYERGLGPGGPAAEGRSALDGAKTQADQECDRFGRFGRRAAGGRTASRPRARRRHGVSLEPAGAAELAQFRRLFQWLPAAPAGANLQVRRPGRHAAGRLDRTAGKTPRSAYDFAGAVLYSRCDGAARHVQAGV